MWTQLNDTQYGRRRLLLVIVMRGPDLRCAVGKRGCLPMRWQCLETPERPCADAACGTCF